MSTLLLSLLLLIGSAWANECTYGTSTSCAPSIGEPSCGECGESFNSSCAEAYFGRPGVYCGVYPVPDARHTGLPVCCPRGQVAMSAPACVHASNNQWWCVDTDLTDLRLVDTPIGDTQSYREGIGMGIAGTAISGAFVLLCMIEARGRRRLRQQEEDDEEDETTDEGSSPFSRSTASSSAAHARDVPLLADDGADRPPPSASSTHLRTHTPDAPAPGPPSMA